MKKGHHHTGKFARGTMHIHSKMGKDPHASAEHHKHNKEHDMAHGFAPPPCYEGHEGAGDGAPGEQDD